MLQPVRRGLRLVLVFPESSLLVLETPSPVYFRKTRE